MHLLDVRFHFVGMLGEGCKNALFREMTLIFIWSCLPLGLPTYTRMPSRGQMDSVLVIEDSRAMQRTLQRLFESDSLEVLIASDGVAGLEIFQKQPPSVVVLDLKLPRLSGKELCRSFKTHMPSVPIVVLSANTDIDDKVLLLELGADDYVTKPFSPKELLARVRRVIRRSLPRIRTDAMATVVGNHEVIAFGDSRVDFTSMQATRAGKPVTLTAQEFKLLKFLASSPDTVHSRDALLNGVWGYQNYPSSRTVDNHILRLRQKLERDPANPRFFVTMHGAGYKFVLDRDSQGESNGGR